MLLEGIVVENIINKDLYIEFLEKKLDIFENEATSYWYINQRLCDKLEDGYQFLLPFATSISYTERLKYSNPSIHCLPRQSIISFHLFEGKKTYVPQSCVAFFTFEEYQAYKILKERGLLVDL